MATGDLVIAMISGDGATAADAVTAYNTAVATLLANGTSQSRIWLAPPKGTAPVCLQAGIMAIGSTPTYTAFGQFQYLSA